MSGLKQNKSTSVGRRDFLKKAASGAVGLTIISKNLLAVPPSDRIVVAHIGAGNMGRNHINWFSKFRDVEIAALCDVDSTRLAERMKNLSRLRAGQKTKAYSDFRRILERDDIDAITCATPDHWHALIAIMAFQAGKDVYGEKPLSYCPEEGRVMLENMKNNRRVFQLGTQIHASDNYHRVVELIRSGRLGEIHTVRLWKTGHSPGMGFRPNCEPPSHLDWEMWQGPAGRVPYNPARCHGTFRYFLDYSGGIYQDFWCHIADIAFWALKPSGLRNISARGEPPWDGIADAPAWLDADFEFDGLKLHWTTDPPDIPGAGDRHIGCCFEGSKGMLVCDYDSREIIIEGEVLKDIPDIPSTIARSPGHQRNFLDCVKSRKQPESNLPYVRQMTLPMHLGLISWRLGRSLTWDSNSERFVGDPAANYLLSRPYHKPWKLG
jgi:predicted dehydrogenase